MLTNHPTPIRTLMRDVAEHAEGVTGELRQYRVTVTNGRTHVRYTTLASSWYCAWLDAIEKHGIGCVITVQPTGSDGRPRLRLVP